MKLKKIDLRRSGPIGMGRPPAAVVLTSFQKGAKRAN